MKPGLLRGVTCGILIEAAVIAVILFAIIVVASLTGPR